MSHKKSKPEQESKTGVDWSNIHDSLNSVTEALDRSYEMTIEEKRRILKSRADALAAEGEDEQAKGDGFETVEFILSSEKYCIEIGFINEVAPIVNLTPIPCTPPYIRGVSNLRGQVISVIDIRKFFDLPVSPDMDRENIIFLQSEETEFGVIAEEILGVRYIFSTELQPSLPTLTDTREKYLKGVTADRTVILNAQSLLSDKAIVFHEEVNE
ncbi:MAG: chemotaxis protein CheW [bacterium]